MKKVLLMIMMVIGVLAFSACGNPEETSKPYAPIGTVSDTSAKEDPVNDAQTTVTQAATTEKQKSNEPAASPFFDMYPGVYYDYEYKQPELKIQANGDGTYHVNIGIIRLASFEDVDAVMTEAGLEFTTTDDSGNPIKGVITLDGKDAVVTFTESTWSLIPSGTVYKYYISENQ